MPTASLAALDVSSLGSQTLYVSCAVAGGVVLAVQFLLLFVGGDVADGEVDLDVESDGLSFFSIRSIAAFLTFFGLVGVYGHGQGWSDAASAGAGFGAGTGMMVLVAWLFSLQSKLHQDGNVDPAGAVGKDARVYLMVPAAGAGKGKITLALQGRTAEFAAVTDGPELPTGTDVVVHEMVNETTFVVRRA
ncbi:MAG: hypothetical protein AAFP22_07500 [Planctomycetota bacterium]